MKKRSNIAVYLTILIVAFVFLNTGCESIDFKVEKAFWKALHLSKKVFENPTASTPYELKTAVDAFRKIIDDFSGNAQAVNRAQMSIGYIYLAKKDYETARNEFSRLISDCDEKSNVCAEATFSVGNCYEIQGDWENAEKQYKKIMDSYYFTRKGLEIPLYLINKYRATGQLQQMKKEINYAVEYYTRLKTKPLGKNFSYLLSKLTAQCHLLGQDWPNFIKTLDKIVKDFPINDEVVARTLLTKAFVYEKQLNDENTALSIFDEIQNKYPNTDTAKIVKSYLSDKKENSKNKGE